ncbi:hypothetical protein PIROE2DRAFT_61500 [Piromyces sp. E2]|nr:hypothetical protein PIROE2DRAFT_61500 [Piromyces sp. E2]|eukprot:OUM63078.1 hypothetical protein PIROE2DRAFT_61500 [Piromyces sp. E2]
MKIYTLLSLFVGSVLAYDEYFGVFPRAKLFEDTDYVVPKITVHLNDEDYKNLFLGYQCERDTSKQHLVKNNDCYNAPWVDLDVAMKKTLENKFVDKNSITDKSDLEIINKTNITFSEYEHIINKYSNTPIENIFQSTSGIFKIPEFNTEDASMTFTLNGYLSYI